MKRYKVFWTEQHSKYVYAKDEDSAVNMALQECMSPNCDNQSILEILEIEEAS